MKFSHLRVLLILPVIIILFFAVFIECKGPVVREQIQKNNNKIHIDIKYARGFSIDDLGEYKLIYVYNPWQNIEGKSITYLLYPRGSEQPRSVSYNVAVPVPVRKVICMSTTHIAMIRALDETGSIAGVSGKQYISDSIVRSGIDKGEIPDIGYEQSVNYEMILKINPEVIFMYGVTGDVTAIISRLESLGIPVVLNAEYLENNPLARTEWIKFMSCFYDKLDAGMNFFSQQEKSYVQLKKMMVNIPDKPIVMAGLPWKNTWWVPGGRSYAAVLIGDAGGRYIWDDDTSDEALPLDIEAVYNKAGQSDLWINSGSASSMKELINTDPRLRLFKPFRESQIYNNTARLNPSGGNDYWESGVIYPHIILRDLIHIFHPEVLPEHTLIYYRKLE
jgi:iron complex transport system substrate-binding protein